MFEFFFKYPRAVYERGHFALLGAWPHWVLAVMIVGAGAVLAWMIRSRLNEAAPVMRSWRAWVIWGMQTLLAALVLVLLWQPAITVAELRRQQNIIAVLVDDSRSMAIADEGGTRQAQAVKTLENGVLDSINKSFQTHLYRIDSGAARIGSLKELQAGAPSTRLGDSLKQLSEETSDLPIGAIVLCTDGADNSGGIDAEVISALRARHIPVHTVGFGREHAEHDVELDDAVIAPRTLADSRLAAKVTLHQYGYSGTAINIAVRDVSSGQPKVLATRTINLGANGNIQTETLMFNIGGAGAKTLQISAGPLAGEQNTANNTLTRVVNAGSDARRILYVEGEPRWEYKFIREAEEDDRMVQIVSMDRTSPNKIYRQGIADPKELADGFPSRPEDLFAYQGLILGSVEAAYFTPGQQQLIRDFVDRRGGGLLLLGGQYALADGGWNASAIVDVLPTILPTQPGTFHREADPRNGTTHATAELETAGVDSTITRLVDDPKANSARWKTLPYLMDYEDPGTPKPGASVLADMITPEGRKLHLLITQNFGRGRSAIMATGGSWRWQMSSPLGDTAHHLFWQQLLRWVVSDTPGHVVASVPAQVLLDNGAVNLAAEVRDQQYNPAPDAKVEAHILGPSGVSALVEMTPVPDNPGHFQAVWSAAKTGAYLTEVTAQRADPSTGTVKELGRDVLTFQRMDGVAENFHTEQNRELLERLATATGGQYWKPSELGKLVSRIPYSEAGVTMRETRDLWNLPIVFVVLFFLRFSEWWLRRKWGIV
ncbi:MAG: VWA domain-containing protein [Bryobacterales bacterium]|nr:VWA domain-containing protein [Bryobacterales bacterium]MBV9399874.1 VWA domain-containing protein [Bryobacterales bacterium]